MSTKSELQIMYLTKLKRTLGNQILKENLVLELIN